MIPYILTQLLAMNIAVNKFISNELDIIIHVTASQLSGHCDFISIDCDIISRTNTQQVEHGEDVQRSPFIVFVMSCN